MEPPVDEDRPARKPTFIKTPVGIAVVAVAVILLGAGVFFYNQLQAEKAAALHAQVLAEQRATAALEARRKAELQAKAEADARQRAEDQAAAQRKADAEAARQKAAEEARQREAEANRLLNARGSLAIVTEPAGATISISNLVPRVSPATIDDLHLGRYAVQVSLKGYETVNLDLEVKENGTTNPGAIHLVRQCGGLALTTGPNGASYQVRSAAPRLITVDSDVKRGKTPATLTDLPTGPYVVSFSRDGWPEHTVNVAIEYKKMAAATWQYTGGIVEITSDPAGAQVSVHGSVLGITPLTLKEIPPGMVNYSLELAGFIPATIAGKVEAEQTLHLASPLVPEDRIARVTELDERPVTIKAVEPTMSYQMSLTGGTATVSLVVGRDGVPTDLKVESASDRAVGVSCLEAAAKWRFKPGTIKGHPVKVRVSLPFNIAAR